MGKGNESQKYYKNRRGELEHYVTHETVQPI